MSDNDDDDELSSFLRQDGESADHQRLHTLYKDISHRTRLRLLRLLCCSCVLLLLVVVVGATFFDWGWGWRRWSDPGRFLEGVGRGNASVTGM